MENKDEDNEKFLRENWQVTQLLTASYLARMCPHQLRHEKNYSIDCTLKKENAEERSPGCARHGFLDL